MLRGSEVSKDSYHSPVKKIKTIKNLQTDVCYLFTALFSMKKTYKILIKMEKLDLLSAAAVAGTIVVA